MTLLERARAEGTPLIDGDQVTFVWYGNGAEPAPALIGDFNDWDFEGRGIQLEQVEPDVWAHTMTLPLDAYIEYCYMLAGDERLSDPFNPHMVWNGMDAVNHVFIMPDCEMTDLVARQKGVKRGRITKHALELGYMGAWSPRDLYLYQPPVDHPVPLVVVWDGPDYLRRAYLANIVDNLIAQERIEPVALALLANGREARMSEYFHNELTISSLVRIVIPFAQKHLNLIDYKDQPGSYGVLGASMGGLMALYTGIRFPFIFGKVISQSGAFDIQEGYEMVIDKLIKQGEGKSIKIWQDVGTLEWLLEGNRKMNRLLRDNGYDVTYREFQGGHNYTMWSDNVWRGLELVFGSKPMDKTELLTKIGQVWDQLQRFVTAHTPAELTEPTDAAGWTAKDHLMHLAVWEGGIVALLDKQDRPAYMGIDQAMWLRHDWDEVNAVIQARYRDVPLEEVLRRHADTHRRLLAQIEALSWDDLQKPYGNYFPAGKEDDSGDAVINRIIGNTIAHYPEHIEWMEAIIQPK